MLFHFLSMESLINKKIGTSADDIRHHHLSFSIHDSICLLPYVIIGVAIGSIIHGFLPADLVVRLAGADNPLAVPISAIVGIPLYLRVSTMVPIAASLLAKGMSTGAVIALIIGGAGASLPEMAMLKGIFRLPLLIAFITSVMVMAISAGLLVNLLMI
ncbi:MAG: permease [Gammaproteobacteria bacterium]|nr:permease [Gammaproteobacteria bacterium]